MAKVQVAEAIGRPLSWLVAKCEGIPVARHSTGKMYLIDTPWADKRRVKWIAEYTPQVHWAQGGPIIERERINTLDNGGDFSCYYSRGAAVGIRYTGPTPLIAAMRCYVISKLGEEVEVLDELMEN